MNAIEIGKRIREARGDKTQKEVAVALNISDSAIAMYENGGRIPRDDVKEKMARYFGTTVGYLFFNEKVHS